MSVLTTFAAKMNDAGGYTVRHITLVVSGENIHAFDDDNTSVIDDRTDRPVSSNYYSGPSEMMSILATHFYTHCRCIPGDSVTYHTSQSEEVLQFLNQWWRK